MAGCHDKVNAVTIFEIPCPKCGEMMEVFYRDGHHAAEARCEHCGHQIPAGEAFEVDKCD